MTKFLSNRPETPAERTEVIDAVPGILGDLTTLDALVLVTFQSLYDPRRSVYQGACAAADAASLQVALATGAKNEADEAWKAAMERWSLTVVDADNRSLASQLKPLMGDVTVSVFVRQDVQVKLERMPRLLLHVASRPELSGDPAKLDALRLATDALKGRVAEWKAALRARKDAVRDQVAAAAAFDKAYGSLVRAIEQVDPERASHVPVFHRAEGVEPVGAEMEAADGATTETRDDAAETGPDLRVVPPAESEAA